MLLLPCFEKQTILPSLLRHQFLGSEASFLVDGFGGAEFVCAKEMYQFGIIPVDQGIYLPDADCFQIKLARRSLTFHESI